MKPKIIAILAAPVCAAAFSVVISLSMTSSATANWWFCRKFSPYGPNDYTCYNMTGSVPPQMWCSDWQCWNNPPPRNWQCDPATRQCQAPIGDRKVLTRPKAATATQPPSSNLKKTATDGPKPMTKTLNSPPPPGAIKGPCPSPGRPGC